MTPRRDAEAKEYLLARAKNLYLRGPGYTSLPSRKRTPSIRQQLKDRKYKEAMAPFGKEDVPLLYSGQRSAGSRPSASIPST